VLVVLIVITAGLWGFIIIKSDAVGASPAAPVAESRSTPAVNPNLPQTETSAPPSPAPAAASVQTAAAPAPAPAAPVPEPAIQRAALNRSSLVVSSDLRPVLTVNEQPVAATAAGTLAVSSPASVDIYKDDAYLASTPVSLELPAGMHTLEYRHGNLRKNVTHVINGNETTRAMVTFEVSVQINSRPWAEVFLDGIERKALGQTPLSGVRVPIGSVLIFENPQFQAKRYRVTGNERIQIVFP
jgi:hypothetical protein